MTGPAEDPSDRPTQLADYGAAGPRTLEHEPDRAVADDSVTADGAPGPWYRNRLLQALWALALALVLALLSYGAVELVRGGGAGSGSETTTSTTPSTTATSSTSLTSTPTTTEPPPPSEAPPPSAGPETPQQTPEEAPPPAANSPAPAEPPHHHHHLPHVPSTITLPHTVITVPHGH